VPAALDQAAVGGEVGIELLGERKAHMRAAIDKARDGIAPPDREAMEATGLHLEHEVARRAVRNDLDRAEPDARRGGGKPFGQGSFALGKPVHAAS